MKFVKETNLRSNSRAIEKCQITWKCEILSLLTSPESTCPVHSRFIPSTVTNNTHHEKTLPGLVNAMALVINKLTKPAPFVRVATEKSVVTRTNKAPSDQSSREASDSSSKMSTISSAS